METIENPPKGAPDFADTDEEASITDHESLPFALPTEAPELHGFAKTCSTESTPPITASDESYACRSHPTIPALASSVVSSPTDDGGSQASSGLVSESHASLSFQPGSQDLDAAASLLLPNSSLAGSSFPSVASHDSSHHMAGATWSTLGSDSAEASAETEGRNLSSAGAGFSQLLNQADDGHESPSRSRSGRLPVLPEEDPVVGRHSPARTTLQSQSRPESLSSERSSSLMMSQQTIVAAAASSPSSPRSPERRMASLAGATATRTSDASFTVAVELSSSSPSSSSEQQHTVRDVMDVVGNPDWLPLWCDAIPSLIITSSSEGAAGRETNNTRPDRQYEGEWIEATTTTLIPPNNTSCLYHSSRLVRKVLGFPMYGSIVMFVERQRGQMGLTMGPFAGGVTVSHKLRVEPLLSNRFRIVDQVQLQRQDEASFCGLWDAMSRVILPTVDDYMDQVLSSMARLRFLVENGGETAGYMPPTALHAPLLEAVPTRA